MYRYVSDPLPPLIQLCGITTSCVTLHAPCSPRLYTHTHRQTHTQCLLIPPADTPLQYNMTAGSTALLGDWHRPPTHPKESIHLRPNHPTINCDSKPETSHHETSVLSQGRDYAMLTGASNTVDIHDLLDTPPQL